MMAGSRTARRGGIDEMNLKVRFALGFLVIVAGLLPVSAAAAPPYPNSMASTGDSITRAFDMSIFPWCLLTDCPAYSWSTGTNTSVNSQYRRLLTRNPGISGHVYNDAKTGANMYALHDQ